MANIENSKELLEILNEYKERLNLLKGSYKAKQQELDALRKKEEEVAVVPEEVEKVEEVEQKQEAVNEDVTVETSQPKEGETVKEEPVVQEKKEESDTFTTDTGKKVYINPAFQQNRNQNPSRQYQNNQRPGDKPPYNRGQNGQRPGFNKPSNDYVAPPTLQKANTAKNKKTSIKNQNEEKKGLSKRDLLKRGYEYDSSLENDNEYVRFKSQKKDKKVQNVVIKEITEAVLNSDVVPVKVFSEKIGKPVTELIKKFFDLGKMININSTISFDEAELIASDYGITLTLKADKTAEDKLTDLIKSTTKENEGNLVKRPPIVTIMGHVDHGKTSLLDYIRKSNVIATEAGGITQHIGAYTIDVKGEKITFLDTPGHEAFTAMRKRGAQVTDIAVIVIAADDTIMPQTIEAISHAKEAGVSIIVAANKIDKTNGDYSKLLQQLPNYDLVPEEWGGDTMVVPISAKFGTGVDVLLDDILLVAEMLELKAVKDCPASGSIIEARLDKAIGPVATVLVKNGTLHVKDYIVAGTNIGRIRAMKDCTGKIVKEALPSYAVQIQGFSEVPNAGDTFVVVKDEKLAKQVAADRADKERARMSMRSDARTLEEMFKDQPSGDIKVLPIILKTDVQGSCEAVKQALLKINDERVEDNVKIKIVLAGVGAINESDIMLADTTNAIILGFNVRPEAKAKAQAEREKIDIRTYSIIYDAIDDINNALSGLIGPSYKETALGRVEIRNLFKISGVGMIAGCYVLDGAIQRNCGYRLLRDNIVIHTGKISSLKRMKDDVKEVNAGYECGVGLDNYNDFKEGDILETFIMEQE